MKLSTPLTRKNIQDHFTYHFWKYLLLIAAAIFVWSMVYIQTEYRPPEDKRIDVYFKSASVSSDDLDAYMEPIWHQAVPDMELVRSVSLALGTGYESSVQISVYIAAAEADIYILPKDDFKTYATNGAFVDLEPYVSQGLIDLSGLNVNSAMVQLGVDTDANGFTIYEESPRLFGVPLDGLEGLSNVPMDPQDLIMAIATRSGNEDNVVLFFNAFLQAARSAP